MTPKVSICIPAYKQPEYLRRALESIFCQTFNDYEIIITDDSPDESIEKVVRKFKHYANFRYYKNKVRKGSPKNWNEAVSLASGEYIKLLHHDDWFADKNSLAEFVDMLEQNPQADLAFCSSLAYCSSLVNCELEQKLRFVHIPSDIQVRQLIADPHILFAGNFIGAPSATIYRRTVDQQFDSQLKWHVDVDFYIRVLNENKSFVFSKKPLICITSESVDHPTVTSECVRNKSVEVFERLYLYRKISENNPRDYQRLKVVWKMFDKYDIRSQQDIINCGVDFPVPQDIAGVLLFRKIFGNDILLLPKVYHRVKILISMGCRKIKSTNEAIREKFKSLGQDEVSLRRQRVGDSELINVETILGEEHEKNRIIQLIARRWSRLTRRNETWRHQHQVKSFYSQFLGQDDLCFDVGAYVGNRMDVFLALGARVVCVEPQPKCVSILTEQYRKNPQVVVVPKGVAAQQGIMSLYLCESASTIATFSDKWKTGRFRDYRWESTVDVPMTTLDALIQEFGVPAFCKIDVEGFEYQVLQGLSSPIPALSFEFTKEFINDAKLCMDYLTSIGPVEFNYSLGESMALALFQWTDANTILDCLHQITDNLLWGDIYARFQSAQ